MSDETGPFKRAFKAITGELKAIHPRLHAYNLAARLLPARNAGELRVRLLKRIGFVLGDNTRVEGDLQITGAGAIAPRLTIGSDCVIGAECTFDLSEALTVGDRVTLEPGVMVLTSTHELDAARHRAGPVICMPVRIGDGAWLRARCIILPGVEIGAGAIVDAGAVVTKSVEPNTRVGGIPAVRLETLSTT